MKYFYILFFVFIPIVLFAQDRVIQFEDAKEIMVIGETIEFLEDKTGTLTINDVLSDAYQQQFKLNNKKVFTYAATRSAFWFKITVNNLTNDKLWLEAGSTYARYIDFFALDSSSNYSLVAQTGTFRPEQSKLVDVNLFWFPLTTTKPTYQTQNTYYLRVEEALTFELPLQIGTLPALYKNKTKNDFLTAGFLGIMIIMILYNAFIYLSTKDIIYVYYIGYLLLMSISMTYANGYPFIQDINIGFIDKKWWNNYFLFWHPFVYLFIGIFCIKYLNLSSSKGKIVRQIIIAELVIISGVFPLLTLFGVELVDTVAPFQGCILLLYATCLVTAYYYAFKGDKQARFYALGWTFMITGVFTFFFVLFGVIPFNPYTRNALYFGVALEVWMFSLALGDRMNIIRREKEFIQAELLKTSEEHRKFVETQNKRLEEKVEERTEELNVVNEELSVNLERLNEQNILIEKKNQDILSSITYAQQIQGAILPSLSEIKENLPKSMIFFRPKDVVSGDFYFYSKKEQDIFIASVDCTGHGVPGAFMSLIGNDLLHQIIHAKNILHPDEILNTLRLEITRALKQKSGTNRDGMDIAICRINLSVEKPFLEYAGAKQPLVYFQQGEMHKIKGDKIIIGGATDYFKGQKFKLHKVFIDKPTTFYLYSDGIQDQFGGERNKKFMPRRLYQLLTEIQEAPFTEQEQKVEEVINTWKGFHKQIDDMLLIGFKLES